MLAGWRIPIELWISAALVRVLKRFVPLERLVHLMHRRPTRATGSNDRFRERLESYLNSAGPFPRRPPANCLERSLGAYRLLCAAAARPELVIGVRRDPTGAVGGHVWIRLAGRPLAEREDDLTGFVPVVVFDADARRLTLQSNGGSAIDVSLLR